MISLNTFASMPKDEKVFMAKQDTEDGFWHLDCEEGKQLNFAYVLTATNGPSTKLLIPNSLQMGWIELPPYLCVASETGWDVA